MSAAQLETANGAETAQQPAAPASNPADCVNTAGCVNETACTPVCGLTQLLDVLTMAAAIAFAAGAAEGTHWWIKQRWLHELTCLHPGYFWMAPVCLLAIFAVPALLLAAIACRRPASNVVPLAATLFALIGWLNLLLLWAPSIHIYSSILAACGLAAVTGRFVLNYRQPCMIVARCVLVAGFTIGGVSSGIRARLWEQERRTPALATTPQPPPPPNGAPNVLLIVLDAVRAQSLEIYGADRKVAPNLAALAEQGVTFEHAWSTAPWTLPSQAGMFTGRLPSELSADWLAALDRQEPTLAEELARRGWATGGFVGNTHYCSAETGLARGFAHYEDYRLTLADVALCTALGRRLLLSSLAADCGLADWPARKRAHEVTRGLVEWLDKRPDRPYFAFVNYFDAHDPYIAPDGFRSVTPQSREDVLLVRHWWSARKEKLTPAQVELMERSYEDCIRGLDAHLGKLLAELERRGDLANTLIIVTADHGEHFGDHGLYLHGNSLYEPLLHVPLVVVWPDRIPAGVRVRSPVSLAGLPNTVLSLAGQENKLIFPGQSWTPLWAGEDVAAVDGGHSPPYTISGDARGETIAAEIPSQARYPPCHGHSPVAHGAMQTLRAGDFKYIHGGDGKEELYDLARDPEELTNLVDDPAHRAAALRLRDCWQQRYGIATEHCEH